LKVDAIVTVTNPMTRIAKEMTRTVPIVMAHSRNPVDEGLIQGFARPSGNVTGLASSAGDAVTITEAPKVALM
jgi:putative ABC transport system substrate-binding protein